MAEARIQKKTLIRFNYKKETDMFDTHSYQKGGRVLHMLRNEVGDDAFFKSLEVYLKENEYQAAEIHNLRLAFEKVTGRDLNWFFNQWFLQAGHPELEVTYEYIDSTSQLAISIEQVQEGDDIPYIYILPIDVEIVNSKSEISTESIKMNSRNQVFYIDMEEAPLLVNLDAEKILLAYIDQDLTKEQAVILYKKGGNYVDRYNAIKKLKNKKDSVSLNTIEMAMEDPFWNIRKLAVQQIKKLAKERPVTTKEKLINLAKNDKKSSVRAEAYEALGKYFNDEIDADLAIKGLEDPSYRVVGAALECLEELDKEKALESAADLEELKNETINLTIARMYSKEVNPTYNEFYVRQLEEMDGFTKYPLVISYQEYLSLQDHETLKKGVEELYKVASEGGNWFIRMGGVNALSQIKQQQKENAEAFQKQMEGSDDAELKSKWEQANSLSKLINDQLKELAEKENSERLRKRIEGEID
jgi:aminopeptidase N